MVNEHSNYTINAHQEYSKTDNSWRIIVILSIIAVMMIIIIALIIIICLVDRKLKYGTVRVASYNPELLEQRNQYVFRCLNNMRNNKFEHIQTRFQQSNCIICLDDFEPPSEVCITNE